MSSAPMRIRSPARAGRGISSASGPARRMSSPTMTPEKRFAARVSAPALTLSAVAESDPLAGAHWKRLVRMFVIPCPRKSWFTSAMVPSGSGVFSVTPTAITSPRMARASAGTRSLGARARSGMTGAGRPAGMVLISLTSATSICAARTMRVAMMIGRSRAAVRRCGTRRKARTSPVVRRPTARAWGLISPAWRRRSAAAKILIPPFSSSYPVRFPSCPRMMRSAPPMMNPVRTAFDMNRVRLPARTSPNPNWKTPTRSVRTKRVAGMSASGMGARTE